jgi:hypothetical protein
VCVCVLETHRGEAPLLAQSSFHGRNHFRCIFLFCVLFQFLVIQYDLKRIRLWVVVLYSMIQHGSRTVHHRIELVESRLGIEYARLQRQAGKMFEKFVDTRSVLTVSPG